MEVDSRTDQFNTVLAEFRVATCNNHRAGERRLRNTPEDRALYHTPDGYLNGTAYCDTCGGEFKWMRMGQALEEGWHGTKDTRLDASEHLRDIWLWVWK